MPASPRPGAPGAKQRSRPEGQLRIAALLTNHGPASKLKLAADPELGLHSELEFEPLTRPAGLAANGVSFGLLRSGYLPRALSFSRIPVKRGRWGGKPPEDLQLLQYVPDTLLAEPALRQRGVLRSIASAYADIAMNSGGEQSIVPSATALLLAVELALHGWVDRGRLHAFAAEKGEKLPALPKGEAAAMFESGGLLVWRSYTRRLAERLGELLRQAKLRNPLRKELSEVRVAALLDLKQPGLGGAVLEEFAGMHGLRRAQLNYPRSYILSGDFAPPAMPETDTAVVKAIYADLESNPAASRREFNLRFPSNLNVVAWLYDAELFIELPGWYTITRARLNTHLKKIPAGPGTRVPSVRDLKDQLDLGRREAESLRSWYLQQYAPAIEKKPKRRIEE